MERVTIDKGKSGLGLSICAAKVTSGYFFSLYGFSQLNKDTRSGSSFSLTNENVQLNAVVFVFGLLIVAI